LKTFDFRHSAAAHFDRSRGTQVGKHCNVLTAYMHTLLGMHFYHGLLRIIIVLSD